MPLPSRHLTRRCAFEPLACSNTAVAALAALMLAVCGGAGARLIGSQTRPGAPKEQPSVQLEGCVVDDYFIPRTGTPVRALAADGRLLGNAMSDATGQFRLQLQPRQAVKIEIDRPGGESRGALIGTGNLSMAACLMDA